MSSGLFLQDLTGHITAVNGQTLPTPLESIPILIPDAPGDVDYDVVLEVKFEVVDVIVRKSGVGAGNTITVKNGATAITDAIVAATDKAVTRAGTIDPAQATVLAQGTLRVTAHRAAGSMAALVTVVGYPRA